MPYEQQCRHEFAMHAQLLPLHDHQQTHAQEMSDIHCSSSSLGAITSRTQLGHRTRSFSSLFISFRHEPARDEVTRELVVCVHVLVNGTSETRSGEMLPAESRLA